MAEKLEFIKSGSYATNGIRVDFAGLNTLIYQSASLTTVSASDYRNTNIATLHVSNSLNALNLHRNGPYGWPTWKQTRTADHPVARRLRETNTISWTPVAQLGSATGDLGKGRRKPAQKFYVEPVVSDRYSPIVHRFLQQDEDQEFTLIIKHSYGNNIGNFANEELKSKVEANWKEPPRQLYDELRDMYSLPASAVGFKPFKEFVDMKYREKIWPREEDLYLARIRQRNLFRFNWNSDRNARNETNVALVFDGPAFNIDKATQDNHRNLATQSYWPLDARTNFETGKVLLGYSGSQFGATSYDGSGILQSLNGYDPTIYTDSKDSLTNFEQYTDVVSSGKFESRRCGPLYRKMVLQSGSDYQEAYVDVVFKSGQNPSSSFKNMTRASATGRYQLPSLWFSFYTGSMTGSDAVVSSSQTYIFNATSSAAHVGFDTTPSSPLGTNYLSGRWLITSHASSSANNLMQVINGHSSSGEYFYGKGNHSNRNRRVDHYLRARRLEAQDTGSQDCTVRVYARHLGGIGNLVRARIDVGTGSNVIQLVTSSGVCNSKAFVSFSYGTGPQKYPGGQALWEAASQAGKYPFPNSYSLHSIDVEKGAKSYSLIPEFRISEFMQQYVVDKNGDFLSANDGFLTVTGSGLTVDNSIGEVTKYASVMEEFHKPKRITINCNAMCKFTPYDGFYPAQRTVQLIRLFSESYAGKLTAITSPRAAYQPLFAPGVLYNTIKSGIAVDYPYYVATDLSGAMKTNGSVLEPFNETVSKFRNWHVSSMPTASFYNTEQGVPIHGGGETPYYMAYDVNHGPNMLRAEFESLLEPEQVFKRGYIYDDELEAGNKEYYSLATMNSSPAPLYAMAMNNFLAESMNFFLESGVPTAFLSKPEKTFEDGLRGYIVPERHKNKLYCMDVILSNGGHGDLAGWYSVYGQGGSAISIGYGNQGSRISQNTDHTTAYVESSGLSKVPRKIVMYDDKTAFGPPVLNKDNFTSVKGDPDYTDIEINYANFANVTPPYYNGISIARFTFDPGGFAGVYSLGQIQASSSIEYIRLGDNLFDIMCPSSTSKSYQTSYMQVSASVTLDGLIQGKKALYDSNQKLTGFQEDATAPSMWSIATKYETPILDFYNCEVTQPVSGTAYKGMWHQYGQEVDSNLGIYLTIADVNDYEQRSNGLDYNFASPRQRVASLANLVGFNRESKKLGIPSSNTRVKEAVVTIPFVLDSNGKANFYSIPRYMIDVAAKKKQLESGQIAPGNSIVDMVKKLQSYVLPPKFDFLTYESIDPFVMYVFEFEHVFNRKDVTDMWQNLPPDSLSNIKEPKETSLSISHDLSGNELLGMDKHGRPTILHPETRWMTFKIKQKAKWSYYDITADTRDDAKFRFEASSGDGISSKEFTPKYNYNWPYDFFSMVEMAEVHTEITYVKASTIDSSAKPVPEPVSAGPAPRRTR